MNTYPQCELEPKVGLCNVAVRKYYFDKDEIICKEFSLGDCVGVVPFDTRRMSALGMPLNRIF